MYAFYVCVFTVILISKCCCGELTVSQDFTIQNANHLFNAVHHTMRQWGSSLHHNGMSFWMATVPKDTHFYHGRSDNKTPTGLEWVAFEPEHALVFAHKVHRPPNSARVSRKNQQDSEQVPLFINESHRKSGYLHTYRSSKALRLLYIDGMSAAKSSKGTLDSTDYVFFNGSACTEEKTHKEVFCDRKRAERLCDMAATDWRGSIDGFIRMELGFEVIVCNFHKSLQLVRSQEVAKACDRKEDIFNYLVSVSSRYDGIGGGRVTINYATFASAYARDSLDLGGCGPNTRECFPRLLHTSNATIHKLKQDVDAVILDPSDEFLQINWRSVTDMIVRRYAPRLSYLRYFNNDIKSLQDNIRLMYRPFDDNNAEEKATIDRCTEESIPPNQGGLAATAITHVARRICTSLRSAMLMDSFEKGIDVLKNLMDYLDWTVWKQCKGCRDNEICFIPIWPMGLEQDWVSPPCLNSSMLVSRHGYWNDSPPVM